MSGFTSQPIGLFFFFFFLFSTPIVFRKWGLGSVFTNRSVWPSFFFLLCISYRRSFPYLGVWLNWYISACTYIYPPTALRAKHVIGSNEEKRRLVLFFLPLPLLIFRSIISRVQFKNHTFNHRCVQVLCCIFFLL